MKKTLFIMAAVLALGSGATLALTQGASKHTVPAAAPEHAAEAKEVTVATSFYETSSYPLEVYSSNSSSSTETLYPSSILDSKIGMDTYTITEVAYPMVRNPRNGQATITLMMTTTPDQAFDNVIDDSEFTVVASKVTVEFSKISDNTMRIPLTKPFVMKKGESLVIGMLAEFNDNRPSSDYNTKPSFQQVSLGVNGIHTYYNGWGTTLSDSDLQDTEYVAGLKLKVVEGEVSGGDEAEPIQTTIATSNYDTKTYPLCVYSSNSSSASQTLYPSSILDSKVGLDTYTITELAYPMMYNCGYGVVNVTLLMTTTPDQALTSEFPDEAFDVVASKVTVDFSKIKDKIMRIPLSKPYVMHKGESLVVGFITEFTDNRPSDDYNYKPSFQSVDLGVNGSHTYYNTYGSSMTGSHLEDTDFVAGLDLVYVEGEYSGPVQKDVVDLSVDRMTCYAGEIFAGKSYEFNVSVTNSGTVDVEGYKVEIYNTNDNTVLGSAQVEKKFPAGLSSTVPVNVMFPSAGSYRVAARTVLDTDEKIDNNESDPTTIFVSALAYKAVSLTGATDPKMNQAETYTVTVGNEGQNTLEGYTVKLYLVREGMEDKLVASSTANPAIAAGQTANVNLDYTFTLGGEFGLKGSVAIGDNEPSETEVLKVNVALDKLTPVISEEIPKWDNMTQDFYGYLLNRNALYSASQVLYTADRFGDHPHAYQIQSLTLHINQEEYRNGPTALKIWLAQTDKTDGYENSASLVPEEDFVLVYDGAIQPVQSNEPQEIKLDLQRLFTLENGKSLAINFWTGSEYQGVPTLYLCAERTEENCYIATETNSETGADLTVYNGSRFNARNFLPIITFGYALEPLAAKMDLAVTDFKMTSDIPSEESTEPINFRVYLENMGTVDVEEEEYNIELVNLDSEGKVTEVLGTYPGSRYLAASATVNQVIKHTFEKNGTYILAARIVVDGETNEADNISNPIDLNVTWVPLTGIEEVIGEGTLVYDPSTSTLRANIGEGVLSIVDLAGHLVAKYDLNGAAEIRLELADGIYLIYANGKTLKIRK